MDENFIGLAGELRVMSELLLRGHNPAKSYLDFGIDLILETGKRIQIKSGHIRKGKQKRYEFPLTKNKYGKYKKKAIRENIDFIICWCINDDVFYIFPKQELENKTSILIVNDKQRQRDSWYKKYLEKWELLLQE